MKKYKSQEDAIRAFEEFVKRRKAIDREKLKKGHDAMMEMAGPAWFQELSPTQLKTVNNLKNSILQDLNMNTLDNTKEVIAILGINLRPSSKYMEIALKQCCQCPVEFLLILYQLINRHRKKYSLNDRLLLSAVVHLTIKETLKELHVRIPSPPPPLKRRILPKRKPIRHKPHSPYLRTFDFVPKKREFTGIYKNNHVQYPESPYFTYISEMRQPPSKSNIRQKGTLKQTELTETDKEILAELESAQLMYDNIAGYEPTPRLLKPAVYVPYDCKRKVDKIVKKSREDEDLQSGDCQCQEEELDDFPLNDCCCCTSETSPVISTCNCDSQITSQQTCTPVSKIDEDIADFCSATCRGRHFIKPSDSIHDNDKIKETKAKTPGECKCLKEYNYFERKHTACMQAYFDYMKNLKEDIAEYIAEVEDDPRYEGLEDDINQRDELNTFSAKKEETLCEYDYDTECNCNDNSYVKSTEHQNKSPCTANTEEDTKLDDIDEERCICNEDLERQFVPLYRFVILAQFPQEYPEQLEILKQALEVLAKDNYPLAKLPDCHKLPVFKLWLKLRAGGFWTQEEKLYSKISSLKCWHHTNVCVRKFRLPKLQMDREEIDNCTWGVVGAVKKMAGELVNVHYRNVKQSNVDDGREFFPSLFSNNFPAEGFRDCYFAYMPSKEEDSLAIRIWQPHEVRKH